MLVLKIGDDICMKPSEIAKTSKSIHFTYNGVRMTVIRARIVHFQFNIQTLISTNPLSFDTEASERIIFGKLLKNLFRQFQKVGFKLEKYTMKMYQFNF